jgi:hypothetical protein
MHVSLTKREGQKSLRVMPIVIVRTLSISVPIIYINKIRGIGFTIRSKRTNWSDYATRWCARHFYGADGGFAEESREGRAQAAGNGSCRMQKTRTRRVFYHGKLTAQAIAVIAIVDSCAIVRYLKRNNVYS